MPRAFKYLSNYLPSFQITFCAVKSSKSPLRHSKHVLCFQITSQAFRLRLELSYVLLGSQLICGDFKSRPACGVLTSCPRGPSNHIPGLQDPPPGFQITTLAVKSHPGSQTLPPVPQMTPLALRSRPGLSNHAWSFKPRPKFQNDISGFEFRILVGLLKCLDIRKAPRPVRKRGKLGQNVKRMAQEGSDVSLRQAERAETVCPNSLIVLFIILLVGPFEHCK